MDHLAGCVQPSHTVPPAPSMIHTRNYEPNIADIHTTKVAPYHSFMIPIIPINFPTATHTSSLPGSHGSPPSTSSGYDAMPRTRSPPSQHTPSHLNVPSSPQSPVPSVSPALSSQPYHSTPSASSEADSGHGSPGSSFYRTPPSSLPSHGIIYNCSKLPEAIPRTFQEFVPDKHYGDVSQKNAVDHLVSKESLDPMWRPW